MISCSVAPLLYLLALGSACPSLRADERLVLLVVSMDPSLDGHRQRAAQRLRAQVQDRLLPPQESKAAVSMEGGRSRREQSVLEARAIVSRAEERFRELEDEQALRLIAKATTQLAAVHQQPGAIGLLARAHLLAGAIYLARNRLSAARQRLQRALDLDPDLSPARHRFAPQVLSEVASLKSAASVRAMGRLEIDTPNQPGAEVFVDGQRQGKTPLVLDPIGAGRHLLRVSAPGYISHTASVRIEGLQPKRVRVRLSPDAELQQINALPGALRLGRPASQIDKTLALIAQRVEADRALMVALTLSPQSTGTATVGALIHIQGMGQAYTPSLEPKPIAGALKRALQCARESPPRFAPPLLGQAPLRLAQPGPVPLPTPWWERPWFWGVAALTIIGISGALIIGRTAGGPPEAIEITLIPRP